MPPNPTPLSAPAGPAAPLGPHVRLGRFDFWPARRLLLEDGRPHRLGGRAFDVLMLLLQHHDRVVGREEILEAAWPGLAVEPNNLQVQVWALRRVLGKGSILTVPRRGYRYVGPAPESAAPPAARRGAPPAAPPALPAAGGETWRPLLRWRSRAA